MNRKSMTRGGAAVAVTWLGLMLTVGGCAADRPQRATIEPTWSYVRAQSEVDQLSIWPVRDTLTELRAQAPRERTAVRR